MGWFKNLQKWHTARSRKFHEKSSRVANNWDYVKRVAGVDRYDSMDDTIEKVAITLMRLRGEERL